MAGGGERCITDTRWRGEHVLCAHAIFTSRLVLALCRTVGAGAAQGPARAGWMYSATSAPDVASDDAWYSTEDDVRRA